MSAPNPCSRMWTRCWPGATARIGVRCWRPGWSGATADTVRALALNDVVRQQVGDRPHHGLRDLDQRPLRQLARRRRHGDRHGDRLDRLRAVLRRAHRRAGPRRLGAGAHLPAYLERPADRGARRQQDPAAHVGSLRIPRPGHLRRHARSAISSRATICMSRAPMPKSPCCIRRATTTTGCCAPSCTGAAARTAARPTPG